MSQSEPHVEALPRAQRQSGGNVLEKRTRMFSFFAGMGIGSSGVTGFFQVASEQATVDIELSAYDGRPVDIVQRNVGSRPTVPIQVYVPLFTYE